MLSARAEQRFDTPADRLCKDGRCTIGGNGNDDGRAVDDRSKLELAISGLVDDVDRSTCGMAALKNAAASSSSAQSPTAIDISSKSCGDQS